MPPRRKAAAVSQARTRTLQSFTGKVSKNVSSTGKAAAIKQGILSKTEAKKQDVKSEKISLKIIQDGDEDILVPVTTELESATTTAIKAEESVMVEVSTTSKPEPAPTPAKKRKRVMDDFFSPPAKKPTTATHQLPSPPKSSPPLGSLPADLTLLQTLHGSLLTALLLHKAHHNNGTHPASFSAIKLHVERLARRNINFEDLRRIVYISHYGEKADNGGFKLVDYGAGNICIDFIEKSKARKLVSTKALKEDFEAKLWLYFRKDGKGSNPQLPTPPSSFTEDNNKEEEERAKEPGTEKKSRIQDSTVPLAEISAHPQASTIQSVLHSKTQALIQELRKPASPSKSTTAPTATVPLSSRTSTLYDRIRAKAEAAASARKKAPSKESLARTAAEQRIPEIEPILKGLAARGTNMTMKNVVEGIKESMRNPISMEDAEMVVRVMAEKSDGDKAKGNQGWIKVVEVGKVTGVVFTKRGGGGFE
ncbi:hypothetical protein L873DRAFT_1786685 [Choiromyces venosus 120613-1]|uniref:DNA replication factor Cdt1 C-terminal domain-containing protein n=1 Tax=Choiromyces venosus 120613-1 TaxID=1336337 RepID=A0A3N4K391_9PEZI|nr:hypothetical protein L873DRAFT_1786685 [Choiromyces venosus 120613-1]